MCALAYTAGRAAHASIWHKKGITTVDLTSCMQAGCERFGPSTKQTSNV